MKSILVLILLVCGFCIYAQPNWPLIKSVTHPFVALQDEYTTPFIQPLAVNGWEDGIFISRDGLNLYCIYAPVDLFSWTFVGPADPTNFSAYLKGPTFGMDLVSNPVEASQWLQADILYAHRNDFNSNFDTWQLSNLANPIFSEGAPQLVNSDTNTADLFVYTSNNTAPNYNTDILLLRNVDLNPSIQGTALPFPLNTEFTEDNPHIERINQDSLVLFFDSSNKPGGVGDLDIWFSTSGDDGSTWTNPQQVSSLNTSLSEQQPHLFKNSEQEWYIYFTGSNLTTGKPEIYRSKLGTTGNWDSWQNTELVIGAGNAFGVGEPTLTQYGDISFVVIYADTINGTNTDKYDADPWFLPRIGSPLNSSDKLASTEPKYSIFPNPFHSQTILTSSSNLNGSNVTLYSSIGQAVKQYSNLQGTSASIEGNELANGIYFVTITKNNKIVFSQKLMIE